MDGRTDGYGFGMDRALVGNCDGNLSVCAAIKN
jgi:hypothetical protein